MKIIIFVFALVFLAATQPESDVEAVLELLNHLRQQSRDELNALLSQWRVTEQRKSNRLGILAWTLSGQQGQCQYRRDDVDLKFEEIRQANAYIDWMITRKLKNSQRLELLQHKLCESQIVHIDGVKSTKIFVNIIEYFRKALRSYQQENEFIQKAPSQSLSEISKMLRVYNDAKAGKRSVDFLPVMAQILQDAETHEDDGNGDEHTLSGTVGELLGILDDMEAETKAIMGNGQDNSVESGVTFSDYKARIERENETFDKMILTQRELIEYLSRQLVGLNLRVDKCEQQLRELQNSYNLAEQEFGSIKKEFTIALLRIQEELDLFDELYEMYAGQKVDRATDEFRQELEEAIKETSQHEADPLEKLNEILDTAEGTEGEVAVEGLGEGVVEGDVEGVAGGDAEGVVEGDAEGVVEGDVEGVADNEAVDGEVEGAEETGEEQNSEQQVVVDDIQGEGEEQQVATGEGQQQQVAVGEGDSSVTVSHNAEDGTHDVTIGGGSSGCCSGSDTVIVVEDDDEDEENAEPAQSAPAQAEPADAEPVDAEPAHEPEAQAEPVEESLVEAHDEVSQAGCCSGGSSDTIVVVEDDDEDGQSETNEPAEVPVEDSVAPEEAVQEVVPEPEANDEVAPEPEVTDEAAPELNLDQAEAESEDETETLVITEGEAKVEAEPEVEENMEAVESIEGGEAPEEQLTIAEEPPVVADQYLGNEEVEDTQEGEPEVEADYLKGGSVDAETAEFESSTEREETEHAVQDLEMIAIDMDSLWV